MHRLGFYTLCIFYILLRYTAALSSDVSFTAPPSTTLANLAASTQTSALDSSASNTDSDLVTDTDTDITSHTTSRSHRPHLSAHSSSVTTRHTWMTLPPSPTSSSPLRQLHPQQQTQASTIAGIIFGTLAGLVLMLSVGRCWWSWRHTPSRDRIATLMHRYNLEREMEDALVQPFMARVRRPPPPPYRPRPPGYDSAFLSSPPLAHLELPPAERM